MTSSKLLKFQEQVFIFVSYFSMFLYALVLFGVTASAPKYISTLNFFVPIYVSLFLLLRFNPFRKIEFTDFDRRIAFSAGLFIFTTNIFNKIVEQYLINNNFQLSTLLSSM
jgi:hypothetical protein